MKKLLLTIVICALPSVCSAAQMRLVPTPAAVGVGDTFDVDVLLSATEPVNTVSGVLTFSNNVRLVSTSDGNSVVSLWVTKPQGEQSIEFAGLIPGGYAGKDGRLFVARLRATAPGEVVVAVSEPLALSNDGTGRSQQVSVEALKLVAASSPQGGVAVADDAVPPEAFVVERGKDAILEGRAYIAFSAVDKNSGVDHYEVAESRLPFAALEWKRAESPYVLNDQHGTSDAYVKAVDGAGNEQVSMSARQQLFRPHEWLVLVVLLAGALYYWYAKR